MGSVMSRWTRWYVWTAEAERYCENVHHKMMTYLLIPASIVLLSCLKENCLCLWKSSFHSLGIPLELILMLASFFLFCIKDNKSLFSTLACNCLPVANVEEERSAACWFNDFLSLSSKQKQLFQRSCIDPEWSAQWKLITLGLLLISKCFGLFL